MESLSFKVQEEGLQGTKTMKMWIFYSENNLPGCVDLSRRMGMVSKLTY